MNEIFEADSVLPHRQLRIGQEENNRPAEQAVRSKTIKFRLGGFLFVYNRLYSLHFVLVKLQLGRFCPKVSCDCSMSHFKKLSFDQIFLMHVVSIETL